MVTNNKEKLVVDSVDKAIKSYMDKNCSSAQYKKLIFKLEGSLVKAVLHKKLSVVEFANAGHPYPLLYSAAEDTVIELKQETEKQYGILGVEGLDVSFPPVSFRAAQDDILICYTDGLTDCMNHKGEEFGKERIIKAVQLYHKESAIMIMNRIMDKFRDFIGNQKITDDITLLVLKRVNSKDYIEEI